MTVRPVYAAVRNPGKSEKEPGQEGHNACCLEQTTRGGNRSHEIGWYQPASNGKTKAGIELTEHATVRREIRIGPWDAWQEASERRGLEVLSRKCIRGRKES